MNRSLKKICVSNLFIIPLLFSCAARGTPLPHVHSELQAAYLRSDPATINNFAHGAEELSHPDISTITVNNPQGNGKTYMLDFQTDGGSDHRQFTSQDTTFSFTNLMINSRYIYNIKCDNQVIQEGEFKTEDSIIRNLYIDGITNVRDMGGYKTIDNKTVKQGLMYRSSALNLPGSIQYITQKGINTMLNDLKIKTEIDLRGDIQNPTTTSVLGDTVNFHNIRMIWNWNNDQAFLLRNLALEVFHLFAVEANYPIDFHCQIGTDRTGLIGLILDCLLGVNEHDIYCDYLFSNFGAIGSSRSYKNVNRYYLNYLNTFDGDNLSEKAVDYLTRDFSGDLDDQPLTIDEVNSIRSIMLED